jgi:putative addiction module component (TIGR02574 family)
MARSLSDIREDIQSLTEEDKEILLRDLIVELDEPLDEDVERAWLEEAHRRLRELDDGSVKSIPAEEVFERLRSRLTG